jgi:hypothetical protein
VAEGESGVPMVVMGGLALDLAGSL